MTPQKTRAPRILSFMFTMSVRWFLAAVLLALWAGPASAAQVQLPVDALMQDAGEYATRFGVPFDEALRRMRAQGATVPTTDALRETYKDRWAGVAIEHQPNYRIVVLLTGTDPVADQSVMAGGMVVPIVFRTGAPATREAVLAAITAYQAKIRESLPHPPGLGVDQRTGELVVMIASGDADLDRDGALRTRIATMTGVPVRIEAVDKPSANMAQDQVAPAPTLIPAPVDGGAIEGGGASSGRSTASAMPARPASSYPTACATAWSPRRIARTRSPMSASARRTAAARNGRWRSSGNGAGDIRTYRSTSRPRLTSATHLCSTRIPPRRSRGPSRRGATARARAPGTSCAIAASVPGIVAQ
ncbi:hypothetical protein QP150_13315 [Sphingomonas sp. 22L2VL55-3]